MKHVYNAVVWIDHREARVIRFGEDDVHEMDIHSHNSLQSLHHGRTGWEAGGDVPDDAGFFKRIIDTLVDTAGTLVTGPGDAKSALKTYLDNARPEKISRTFVTETPEPSDATALLALGRQYLSEPGEKSGIP